MALVALAAAASLVAGGLVALGTFGVPGGSRNADRDGPPRPEAAAVRLDALPGGFDGPEVSTDGWSVDAASGTSAELTTRAVHTGRAALRLDTSATRGGITVGSRPQPVTAGQEYGASAFSIVTSGRARLRLQFLDRTGAVLTTADAAVPVEDGIWSRTSLEAVAPERASQAQVVIVVGGRSVVVADDLDWWTTSLPDAGFEVAAGGSARGWSRSAGPDTTVTRVTQHPHSGAAALQLRDSSATASALAASSLTPVPLGAELDVRGWSRTSGAGTTLSVRWFDGERQPLSTQPSDRAVAASASWAEVEHRVAVPDGAEYAQVQIATPVAGRATSSWDDLSLRPVAPAQEVSYDTTPAARMQGFTNTKTSLVSSVNGVPKFSTVVSGSPAVFQLADLRTGTLEYTHEIPGILNGWALTPSLDERRIFIGGQGHVWQFDTATRSLQDLGRATPRATRVFDLVTGPDGRIWGGSYPGGDVWVLDPATRAFTSAGSVGNGNDYARTLAVDADNVYVGTGSVSPDIVQISTADARRRTSIPLPASVRTGVLTQLKVHHGVLSVLFPDGRRGLYDLHARRWVEAPLLATTGNLYQLRSGTTPPGAQVYFFRDGTFWAAALGARGVVQQALARVPAPTNVNGTVVRMRLDGPPARWLVAHDGHTRVVAIKLGNQNPVTGSELPVLEPRVLTMHLRRTALRVKSLSAGRGEVVVGGYGGPSLSVLVPATLRRTRPSGLVRLVGGTTTPKYFGEVEGMVTNGRYQYYGTYPRGRIFRRDLTQPWSPGTNPMLLVDLGSTTEQDRPIAWAVSGSRTFFGTIPDYGVRGGVLGWFDGTATTPVVVPEPVPQQSVVALTTDRSVVYGSTSRWGGLGAEPSAGPPSVFAYDSDRRRLLWTVTPDGSAQAVGSVLHDEEGRLWAATRNRILQLDPTTGRTIRTISLGTSGDPAGEAPDDGDPAAATFVSTAMVSLRGHLYVATGGRLLQVDPGTLRIRRIGDATVSPARIAVVGDELYYPATSVLMRARPR